MVGASFHNILDEKGKIGRERVENALESLGYKISESPKGFDALLDLENNRYHITVDTSTDGEVYDSSTIKIHLDTNPYEIFHNTLDSGDIVIKEWRRILRLLRNDT